MPQVVFSRWREPIVVAAGDRIVVSRARRSGEHVRRQRAAGYWAGHGALLCIGGTVMHWWYRASVSARLSKVVCGIIALSVVAIFPAPLSAQNSAPGQSASVNAQELPPDDDSDDDGVKINKNLIRVAPRPPRAKRIVRDTQPHRQKSITRLAQPSHINESSPVPLKSPAAMEMAEILSLTGTIDYIQEHANSDSADVETKRNETIELIMASSLDVQGVIAEIDGEMATLDSLRRDVRVRRDRASNLLTSSNFLTLSALYSISNAVALRGGQARNVGNVINIVGSGLSGIYAIIMLGQRKIKVRVYLAPNMLARIFERKPDDRTVYPHFVWAYLNRAVPWSAKLTRREYLLHRWQKQSLIDTADVSRPSEILDVLAGSPEGMRRVDVTYLDNDLLMLNDLRAVVGLMNRGLRDLLSLIRPRIPSQYE